MTKDDLISRQAAIDEVSKYASIWMEYDGGMTQEEVAEAALKAAKRTMVHILEELPSAQLEIIHCMDCDWWTKQDDSIQGRCALMGAYPTGWWFCGNARRRTDE